MTQDEIIEMAREAGLDWHKGWTLEDDEPNRFDTFAKLVADREREECKKCCTWKTGNQFVDEAIAVCYRAIDQRGEA